MSESKRINAQTLPTPSESSKYFESPAFQHLEIIQSLSLKNKVPYLFLRGGAVSKVYRFSGLNHQGLSEYEMNDLFNSLEMVINTLPENRVNLSFTVVKKPTTFIPDSDINAPYYLKAKSALFAELCQRRQVYEYEFYITFLCSGQNYSSARRITNYLNSFFKKDVNLFEKNANIDFFGVDERIALIEQACSNIIPMLSNLGIAATPLETSDEYYRELEKFTRPELHKVKPVVINDSVESVRRSLFAGVKIDPFADYFTLDDTYHKVFSMDKAPQDDIKPADIMKILSIPQEMILTFTMQKLDKSHTQKRLDNALWKAKMELSAKKGQEDYFGQANYNRIVGEVQRLAEGQTFGAAASLNLCLRIPRSYIETKSAELNITDKEYVRRVTSEIQSSGFTSFGKSDWSAEREGAVPVFFKMLPGTSHLDSHHLKSIFIAGSDVPYFMPIYNTASAENFNGLNGFVDNNDGIYVFDPLDKKRVAWNYYVIGQTGSGKSVILNSIIAAEYGSYFLRKKENPGAKPPVICIMDEGGGDANSFGKQVDILGGTTVSLSGVKKPYIQLLEVRADLAKPTPRKLAELAEAAYEIIQDDRKTTEAKIMKYYEVGADKDFSTLPRHLYNQEFEKIFGIQPWEGSDDFFKLRPGELEPNMDQMRLIVSTLEIMLAPSTQDLSTFSQGFFREDQVRRMVLDVYRSTEGRFPFISDLVEYARSQSGQIYSEFVDRMSNWCRDSGFNMFDMDTDVDLNNDLILVDFKGIGKEPQLKAIYTLLFMSLFENKMMKQKSQRRFFFVDEAWSMLANKTAREVYIEFLRTARKHRFCTMSSTQTIIEYMKPDRELGQAAIGQMQMGIIGHHKPDLVDLTVEILKLKPELGPLLSKLGQHRENGVPIYSRFMVYTPTSTYVLKNRLHTQEYWVYTSDGDDNFIIDYFLKRGGFVDKEEVIRYVASSQHLGDEGLIEYLKASGKLDVAKKISAAKHKIPV